MSLVSFSTAFIIVWVEGNLLSPEKTGKQREVIKQMRSEMIQVLESLTFEDTGDPAGLHLSLGHDGSEGMDETHDGQCGMLQMWRENVLVQTHTVSRLLHGVFWQVWKIIVVTCGKDNHVHLQRDGAR